MKKILSIVILIVSIVMTACNSKKNQEATPEAAAPKYLVLYYSQTGTTKAVAEAIAQSVGADIEQIDAVAPYDGTYDETIQRCMEEMAQDSIPSVNPLKANVNDYDVIFLGYPVWFGTCASPIKGLAKDQDFDGKKLVTFCTFGSGGLESSTNDIIALWPKAEVVEGYGVRTARIDAVPAELPRFLIEQGFVEGEIAPLPAFGEQAPVTTEEVAVFDAACGDYMFPLGTPVTVAKRTLADANEYKYVADATNPDGSAVQSTIYVLAPADGSKPVFTRVVR